MTRRPRGLAAPGGAVILALAACSSGCVLGPDYVRPSVQAPATYRFANAASTPAPMATMPQLPAWWRNFADPDLNALVDEGLAANYDLRIATSRVDEFAARLTATRASGLPQVGYAANAGRQGSGSQATGNYAALLSASWEIDLWGRIHRQTEAARADLLGTEQARLGVALTLVSSVISGYVTLLDLDDRLAIAESTLAGRKRSVEIFQMRLDGGVVSEFEMSQVLADYEATASTIPDLQRSIAETEHALSVLVGRNPGAIRRRALDKLVHPPVPAGLPSQLIARRPDILQAEQQLVAANALVGSARALYFPQLSLTGSGGSASSELDSLFSGPARSWSFIGQLLGPLYAGGAIKSANLQADARREQALASYERTIKDAFRDVDDALAGLQASRAEIASLQRRVTVLQRSVELARERYDNGYSDYLNVLDAERNLFSAQVALTTARGDGYRLLVALYRALGGDWIGQVAPLQGQAGRKDIDAADDTERRRSPL